MDQNTASVVLLHLTTVTINESITKHLQCKNVWKIVQINRGDTGLVENLDVQVWRSPAWQVKLPAVVKENCLVTKAILKNGQYNGTSSFRWQRQYPESLGTELNRRKTTSQLGNTVYIPVSVKFSWGIQLVSGSNFSAELLLHFLQKKRNSCGYSCN